MWVWRRWAERGGGPNVSRGRYDIMKRGLKMSSNDISNTFAKWNKGVLNSYLIEITRDVVNFCDDEAPIIDRILDQAGQKGTGKWTATNALELGVPVTLIAEAVLARSLSGLKEERIEASTKLKFISRLNAFDGNVEHFLVELEQALYASKIISYTQGFMLMQEVS